MKRPNILVVMADAARPDFIGILGKKPVVTPNIDRLVREGVTFDRCYCASSQCAPSRTSLVTGLYPHSHGVLFNEVEMPTCHKSVAHYLKDLGYRSAWLGKGHNTPRRATFGFDVQRLSECGNLHMADDDYFCWLSEQGVHRKEIYRLWNDVWNFQKRPFDRYIRPRRYRLGIPEDYSFTSWLTAETKTFIDETIEREQPFFAFVSNHAPQNDDALPDRFLDMYDPTQVEPPVESTDPENARIVIADYMAKMSMLDAHLGDIIGHLKAKGILEDTIIVYTSDHGCFLGEYGIYNKMWNYELDSKIPLIVRYSKIAKQGLKTNALCSNIDFVPTLLDILGVAQPDSLQGVSQLDVMRGESEPVRTTAYSESGPVGKQRKAVWRDDIKLLYRTGIDKIELYDLASDPYERNDLSEMPEYREVMNQMIFSMLEEIVKTERYPTYLPERYRQNNEGLFNRL
jgi:arylsulfatase